MTDDGQYGRNKQHILTRLKKMFAVFDGNTCVNFNIIYHNGKNFTKKKWIPETSQIWIDIGGESLI
jgi:hypothetical protein